MFLRHSLLRLFVSSKRSTRAIEHARAIEQESNVRSFQCRWCFFISFVVGSLLFWNSFTWKFFDRKILYVLYFLIRNKYNLWSLFWVKIYEYKVLIWIFFYSAVQIIIENCICCAVTFEITENVNGKSILEKRGANKYRIKQTQQQKIKSVN